MNIFEEKEKVSLRVFAYLWARGAHLHMPLTDEERLCRAAERGDAAAVMRWVDAGGRLVFPWFTLLEVAAGRGNRALVTALLQRGAEVNSLCTLVGRAALGHNSGRTALMAAAAEGHDALVDSLIQHGADVNLQGHNGWTALALAAQFGHERVVELLLRRGAEVNLQDSQGGTALMFAMCSAKGSISSSIVKRLLNAGADVTARTKNGKTALQIAEDHGGESAVECIRVINEHMGDLQPVVRPEPLSDEGLKAVEAAACKGNAAVVQAWLNDGGPALVNAFYWRGRSLLMLAASHGQEAVVELLVQNNADVNARPTVVAKTPLGPPATSTRANSKNDEDLVVTALSLAISNNHPAVVRQLVLAGAQDPGKLVWDAGPDRTACMEVLTAARREMAAAKAGGEGAGSSSDGPTAARAPTRVAGSSAGVSANEAAAGTASEAAVGAEAAAGAEAAEAGTAAEATVLDITTLRAWLDEHSVEEVISAAVQQAALEQHPSGVRRVAELLGQPAVEVPTEEAEHTEAVEVAVKAAVKARDAEWRSRLEAAEERGQFVAESWSRARGRVDVLQDEVVRREKARKQAVEELARSEQLLARWRGEQSALESLDAAALDELERSVQGGLQRIHQRRVDVLERERCCPICMVAPKDVVLVPCGHMLCGACQPRLQMTSESPPRQRCPVCQQAVERHVRTY